MTDKEIAQEIRHIAEKLAGGGDAAEAVDELHALADDIDPGGWSELDAYIADLIRDTDNDSDTDNDE